MQTVLNVDPDELRAAASRWQMIGSDLGAGGAPPVGPSSGPTTLTGAPLCPGDKILEHLLEILAGGALAGASGVAEAPSLGTSTAGLLGGASLIYNGIDGLETCP